MTHGTYNGYNYHGCRCRSCTEAHTEYQRIAQGAPCAGGCGKIVFGRYRPGAMCRACKVASRTRPLEECHGTETGYRKGCRCDRCRTVASKARSDRRRANIEATRAYDRERKRQQRISRLAALEEVA